MPSSWPSVSVAKSSVVLVLLTVVLVCTAVDAGGVPHADQPLYLTGLAVVTLLAGILLPMPRVGPLYRYLLPALLLWTGFQLIPLPVSWVVALSPARAEGIKALADIGITSAYTTLAVFPTATRDYFLLLCGYAAIFLIVRQLAVAFSKRPWILVLPLLVVAGWEALLAIVQYSLSAPGTVVGGNYANRNHLAGLLELTLPFATAWPFVYLRKHRVEGGISTPDALKTAALWTLASAFIVAVIFSQSRMGFICALLSVFVVGILSVATKAHTLPNRRTVALLMAGVFVIVGLAFVFLPTDELIRRYALAVSETDEKGVPDDTRAGDWKESIPLIRSYPIFGCGLGGFISAFPKFKTVTPLLTANFAHNDYLQLTAETGLVGITLLLILAAATLRSAFRHAFLTTRPENWAVALGCCGALCAIALHSTVDFNLYIPANAMVVSWVAALSTSAASSGPSGTSRSSSSR